MILSPTIDVPIIEHRTLQGNDPYLFVSQDRIFGLSSLVLSKVMVGQAQYHFKRPLRGKYDMSDSSFRVDYFSPTITGYNRLPSKAKTDWERAFHHIFQELVALRPFEHTSEQSQIWTLMEKYVDIETYHNSTPLIMTQIGRISKTTRTPRQYPKVILWLDGLQEDISSLRIVPDNFVTLKRGQYFEAIVKRNRLTGKLLQIVDIKRLIKWEKSNDEINTIEKSLFSHTITQDKSLIST